MYKLLIVDDEKMIRLGIKNGIDWEELNISEVYTAASAKEALKEIDENMPDIMITDISMAEMTGLELIKKVREKNANMRILVLTGYDSFDYAREALRMRVHDFLLKPIDEDELKKTVLNNISIIEAEKSQKEIDRKAKRAEGARRQIITEQFMRDLVHGRQSIEAASEIPYELVSDIKRRSKAVLLIPDFYMNAGEIEERLRYFAMQNICMGLIDEKQNGITFSDDENRLVIVFFTDTVEKSITEMLEELKSIIETENDIKPRFVLGSEVQELGSIAVSYNDAVYLLSQSRKGRDSIVKPQDEKNKDKEASRLYQEYKNKIISNISNVEMAISEYEKFKSEAEAYNFSNLQIKRCCTEIITGLSFNFIMETKKEPSVSLDEFISALLGAGNEVALEMSGMFIRKLLSYEEDSKNEIVAKARRYIDEHLEENLSVALIAEKFYLSTNYFSRLFKRVMGEGCNEYIVKKRIEKSCCLLKTTTIKAGRIAAMVGYNDTNYFSLAFKKHTGMSPTKYREKMQERQVI